MSDDMIARLDKLERVAVRAIRQTYNIHPDDTVARFWVMKGIEGMRYAIAHEGEDR